MERSFKGSFKSARDCFVVPIVASGLLAMTGVWGCESGEDDGGNTNGPGSPTDGIWTDPISVLMWQNPVSDDGMSWGPAESYCHDLNLAGYSDWRLPTIEELRSLIRGCPSGEIGGSCTVNNNCLDYQLCYNDSCLGCPYRSGPGKNGMYWPTELDGYSWYWSSLEVESNEGVYGAWICDFDTGGIGTYSMSPGNGGGVRCVRDDNTSSCPNNICEGNENCAICATDCPCGDNQICDNNGLCVDRAPSNDCPNKCNSVCKLNWICYECCDECCPASCYSNPGGPTDSAVCKE